VYSVASLHGAIGAGNHADGGKALNSTRLHTRRHPPIPFNQSLVTCYHPAQFDRNNNHLFYQKYRRSGVQVIAGAILFKRPETIKGHKMHG
jgi:hypothetical protein